MWVNLLDCGRLFHWSSHCVGHFLCANVLPVNCPTNYRELLGKRVILRVSPSEQSAQQEAKTIKIQSHIRLQLPPYYHTVTVLLLSCNRKSCWKCFTKLEMINDNNQETKHCNKQTKGKHIKPLLVISFKVCIMNFSGLFVTVEIKEGTTFDVSNPASNPICLLGFNSNFQLGLFNQTCRQPNTTDSLHFKGGLRWLLFYFNDITYHSLYAFLFICPFVDGTENWNENWLFLVSGEVSALILPGGLIEMHLGQCVSAW